MGVVVVVVDKKDQWRIRVPAMTRTHEGEISKESWPVSRNRWVEVLCLGIVDIGLTDQREKNSQHREEQQENGQRTGRTWRTGRTGRTRRTRRIRRHDLTLIKRMKEIKKNRVVFVGDKKNNYRLKTVIWGYQKLIFRLR